MRRGRQRREVALGVRGPRLEVRDALLGERELGLAARDRRLGLGDAARRARAARPRVRAAATAAVARARTDARSGADDGEMEWRAGRRLKGLRMRGCEA